MQTQEAETFIISQKQAHAFAVAVFADIRAYREAHQAEFEKFLKAEQEKGEGKTDERTQTEKATGRNDIF